VPVGDGVDAAGVAAYLSEDQAGVLVDLADTHAGFDDQPASLDR
jgi:hypothetical protein